MSCSVTNLLADALSAVFTLHGVLDDLILRDPLVKLGDGVKCESNAEEVQHLAEE